MRSAFVAVLALVALVVAAVTLTPRDKKPEPVGTSSSSPSTSSGPSLPVKASRHHLDAHDGGMVQVDQVFYVYGTANDCGFVWREDGTRYCGVSIYSSTDLTSWTSKGLAFDPNLGDWQSTCAPGGCFRPHVVFNPATDQYVMWLNVFRAPPGTYTYRVLTSPHPVGPWTLTDGGKVPSPSGDAGLFVDTDGSGYLVRTDLHGQVATTKTHEIEIRRLDRTFTNSVTSVSRPPVGFVEAPSLFKRDGIYYLLYGDPACPYCTQTGSRVVSARNLAGPWSKPYSISATSCMGQPTMVSPLVLGTETVFLYQSDQWVRLKPGRITGNQSMAHQAWSPLRFSADGRIRPVSCP